MTIDPRIGLWFSIALTVIGVLAISSTSLTDIFGPGTAHKIVAWALLLSTIGNAINGVLHAIPSGPNTQKDFPLGPKDPNAKP